MGEARNFINVIGLTRTEDLENLSKGYFYKCHDREHIYIPDFKPAAKSIFQIILNLRVISHRFLEVMERKFLMLDGYKEFKIIYTEDNQLEKAGLAETRMPFNVCIEVKEKSEIDKIKVLAVDAFFELIEGRRIYSSIFYIVNTEPINYKPDYSHENNIKHKNSEVCEEIDINLFPSYFEEFEELQEE